MTAFRQLCRRQQYAGLRGEISLNARAVERKAVRQGGSWAGRIRRTEWRRQRAGATLIRAGLVFFQVVIAWRMGVCESSWLSRRTAVGNAVPGGTGSSMRPLILFLTALMSVLLVACAGPKGVRPPLAAQGEADLIVPDFAVHHEIRPGEGFRMPDLILPAAKPVVTMPVEALQQAGQEAWTLHLCIEIGIDDLGAVIEQAFFSDALYCPEVAHSRLADFRAEIAEATGAWRFVPAAICTDPLHTDITSDPCASASAVIEPVGVKLAFVFEFRIERGILSSASMPLSAPR